MATKKNAEKAMDALYTLPLDDFTAKRTELEKGLRADGRRDEAAAVKKLRKPTAPAWALNQVARSKRKEVKALITASGRVQKAQEAVLGGGGKRAALDKAVARQRELVKQLTGAAVEAAEGAGIATTAAFEDRVSSTLRAVALDEEVAAELTAGRLVREREAIGLLG